VAYTAMTRVKLSCKARPCSPRPVRCSSATWRPELCAARVWGTHGHPQARVAGPKQQGSRTARWTERPQAVLTRASALIKTSSAHMCICHKTDIGSAARARSASALG